MAESIVQVNSGSGPKLHSFQRAISGNNVEDEVVINGEHYVATYDVNTPSAGTSTATAASHLLQIMAGGTLHVHIRRIQVFQLAVATTAAIDALELVRLTTAGTGGTAVTPSPRDPADAASGCTAMTLPTVKGTEGTFVERCTAQWTQTVATQSGGKTSTLVAEFDFDRLRSKSLRIAAGTTNGIALKNPTARPGATVIISVELAELNFL